AEAERSPRTEGAGPAQSQRGPEEERAGREGGDAVDGAGEAERPRQQRNRRQEDAVDEDLARRCGSPGDNRQHGDAGTGILVGAVERERPEVRRRPQKDDQEQGERPEPAAGGWGRPPRSPRRRHRR